MAGKDVISKEKKEELGELLQQVLAADTAEFWKTCAGGMVNQNCVFRTDKGEVFVKLSDLPQARQMFDGEFASLQELRRTRVIKVPRPITVLDLPSGGAALVMEYLQLAPLKDPEHFSRLGKHIAELHLYTERCKEKSVPEQPGHPTTEANQVCVTRCGFDTITSCGLILQDTSWTDSWQVYWARKMHKQICLLESNFGEKEVVDLWHQLEPKLAKFFKDIQVSPSLLHGDLWEENLGVVDGEIVMFDPGCFYGHSEFDLALPSLCDNPGWKEFFSSYHAVIPKEKGYDKRRKLYQLYHHVNHWNHFPPGSLDKDHIRDDRNLAVTTLQELMTAR